MSYQDLRVGDRLILRHHTRDNPREARAVVTWAPSDGQFGLSFDSHPPTTEDPPGTDRRRIGTPRVRHTYPASARGGFRKLGSED